EAQRGLGEPRGFPGAAVHAHPVRSQQGRARRGAGIDEAQPRRRRGHLEPVLLELVDPVVHRAHHSGGATLTLMLAGALVRSPAGGEAWPLLVGAAVQPAMLLLLGPVRVLPGDAVAPPGVLPVLDPAADVQGTAIAGGVEVEEAGGRLGEQRAVMGDERRRAGMLLQSTGEVREPPGIEMVRRLI